MINRFKKLFLVAIFTIFCLTLSACKSYEDLEHVTHSEIFNIQETEYYIYVYRPNCEVCSNLEETVYKYAKKAKRSDDLPNLYVLNKGDGVNNAGIYCSQEDYKDFVGATTPSEVKTSTSPYLFKIKNGQVVLTIDDGNIMKEKLTL